jgi:hypothetical protein
VLCGGILLGVKFRQNVKNKTRKGLFFHNIPFFPEKNHQFLKKKREKIVFWSHMNF